MSAPHNPAPMAYSYIRFSTTAQAEGDSVRRQTEAARKWCDANGVALDNTVTLRDLGKSAYLGAHRKNPDRYALAAFLKLVEGGKVPHGSALIVESLDRLSREHIRPALTLLLNLIEAGVRVVQLIPVEAVYDENVEPMALMMAIMELSRGHSESAVKSDRVGKAWRKKKREAREGKVVTAQLPAWVELVGGKLRLVPERAAVVKRIFAMAAGGYGFSAIVSALTRDGVPAFGASGRWVRSYVARIASDRRAVGEYQPRNRDGTPDGEPVPDYFPAPVTEAEFYAARAGAAQRGNKGLKPLKSYDGKKARRTRKDGAADGERGPREKFPNVFAGLVSDALDGDSYFVVMRVKDGVTSRVLINSASRNGHGGSRSFPYFVFERAVLSRLAEVSVAEVLGGEGEPNELAVLAGEEARNDTELTQLVADMETNGYSPTLANRARVLEERRRDLAVKIADARQRAANPLSEAWGNCKSLLAAVETASDPNDVRMRLRSVLRRVVESIRIIIATRGRTRLCAIQIAFTSGTLRSYLIVHRPPKANRSNVRQEGGTEVRSFAEEAGADSFDLRKPGDAKTVEKILARLDVEKLVAAIAAKKSAREQKRA